MRHVAELLGGEGWQVGDVHTEGRGYDLLRHAADASSVVEVKGVLATPRAPASG